MKQLFFCVCALVALPAFAAVDCSNAAGTLTYHQWNYEGGAAPPQGLLVGVSSWNYLGQPIAKAEQHNGGPYETLAVQSVETPKTRALLENKSGGAGSDTTYAYQLTLSRLDGSPVLPNRPETTVKDFFICHQVQHFYP